jgi:hypothetical protein
MPVPPLPFPGSALAKIYKTSFKDYILIALLLGSIIGCGVALYFIMTLRMLG